MKKTEKQGSKRKRKKFSSVFTTIKFLSMQSFISIRAKYIQTQRKKERKEKVTYEKRVLIKSVV